MLRHLPSGVVDRRSFLQALGAITGGVVAGSVVGDGAGATVLGGRKRKGKPSGSTTGVRQVDGLPIAEWLVAENARPGSLDWVIHPSAGPTPPSYPAAIEGYLDQVSYAVGDKLTLFVSTSAPHFRADVYRIGYYGGAGGRRVRSTEELIGHRQATPNPSADLNMIECAWTPSATLEVTPQWPPGAYLIKLVGGGGELHYVPFTVRDDASRAAIVVQSSVTTWQAYNLWGGYSLYGGGDTGALADRSRVVSFDRPYRNPDENGSGDFLGNEFPFIFLAEKLGLDVTYWTDVDLHARPTLLENHQVLVSLGHDEYWSYAMRFDGVMNALAKGVNVAFLGANASYRQIRLESSPLGENRRVVCYKDAAADPITATEPKYATGSSWATDPVSAPESEMIGSMYQSYGADSPLVVVEPTSWVFAGTGVAAEQKVEGHPGQNVVGSEFDGFEPALSGPKNVTVLAHSQTSSVSGTLYSDMTYYTVEASPGSSGGGVFATGTARWVQLLWDGAAPLDNALLFAVSPAQSTLRAITLNVLRVFSNQPAGKAHVSVANWRRFYSPSEAPVVSKDVP